MARGINTANHPNRQVGRSSWSAAMEARTREYSRARSGQMSHDEARRVDINLNRLGPPNVLHGSIDPRLGRFEQRLRSAGH